MPNSYLDKEGLTLLWRTFQGHIQTINDIKSGAASKADVEVLRKVVAPTEAELTGATSVSSVPSTLGDFGTIYKITAAYTTTSAFVEGSGYSRPANTYVVVVHNSSNYNTKKLTCVIDLSIYGDLSDYTDAHDDYETADKTINGVSGSDQYPGFVPTSTKLNEAAVLSDLSHLTSDTHVPTVAMVASLLGSLTTLINSKLNTSAKSASYASASNSTVYTSDIIYSKIADINSTLSNAADTTYMRNENFATLSDISAVFRHKGTIGVTSQYVDTILNAVVGDVYTVEDDFYMDNRFTQYDSSNQRLYPRYTNIAVCAVNNGTPQLDIFIGSAVFETLSSSDINTVISNATAAGPIFRTSTSNPTYTVTINIDAGAEITGYTAIAMKGGVAVNGTDIYKSEDTPKKCTFVIQCKSTDKITVYAANGAYVRGFGTTSHNVSNETELVNDAAALYNVITFNPWETNTYNVSYYTS